MAVLTTGVLIIGRFGNLQKEKNHKNELNFKMQSTDLVGSANKSFNSDREVIALSAFHIAVFPRPVGSTVAVELLQGARGGQETALQ